MGSTTRRQAALGLALTLLAACGEAPPSVAAPPQPGSTDQVTPVASSPSASASALAGDGTVSGPQRPADDGGESAGSSTSADTPAQGAPAQAGHCGADVSQEEPIRTDELGTGDRVVRVLNRAHGELQVRLVGQDGEPALAGTLLIAPGATAVFRVPAGHYRLRYRVQTTCEVLQGSPIRLTGPRRGVEIALKPGPRRSPQTTVRRVRNEL